MNAKVTKIITECADRWIGGRKEIEALERRLDTAKFNLRDYAEVKLRLHRIESGGLKRAYERLYDRAQLVEKELGLPDLFASDVQDDEALRRLRELRGAWMRCGKP